MLLLMLGGAVGTYVRYAISKWFSSQLWAEGFPYGTLFINVTGSFILGAAAAIILERLPPHHQHLFLLIGTGFCGGYTTFSTFSLETFIQIRDGSWGLALVNVLASVGGGLLGVILAVVLVGVLFPKP